MKKKYRIYSGLGGGFGGAHYITTDEFDSRYQAEMYARDTACEEYEMYEGLYGLRDIGQIMKEDGLDSDAAWEAYSEERDSWISYYVEEVK